MLRSVKNSVMVHCVQHFQILRRRKKMKMILWLLSQKKRRPLKHILLKMKLFLKKLLRSS